MHDNFLIIINSIELPDCLCRNALNYFLVTRIAMVLLPYLITHSRYFERIANTPALCVNSSGKLFKASSASS